jgi:hypothetical protein
MAEPLGANPIDAVDTFNTVDTTTRRKARGAFFTPQVLCEYVVRWALRSGSDSVLEPSCGEAAFLLAAGKRLRALASPHGGARPVLHGVEIHPASARQAANMLQEAGHDVQVEVADFFTLQPEPTFDAVVGNPPYVRYQDFSGDLRTRSREAALRAGISLTGLASSWAAFTVHSALFLRPGGRLGLVLPAELLSVNYAADVRRFLTERFRTVRLVLFTERVFPGVLEEIVLLLADGFNDKPNGRFEIYQARNLADLPDAVVSLWNPPNEGGKWSPSLVPAEALAPFENLLAGDGFDNLQQWGETSLGIVTGNNKFFTLPPAQTALLKLDPGECLPISPPGSRHLRSTTLSSTAWHEMGQTGNATLLFRPADQPSEAARNYIRLGEREGVDTAYKCRVRSPWWRVPLVPPADLFLTYMNSQTTQLCTNRANVYHLNSVHGVYLREKVRRTGRDLLPLAALNSATLLGAEIVGRAYGGGLLKLEPKEADRLPVPSTDLLEAAGRELRAARATVIRRVRTGDLIGAVQQIDEILLRAHAGLTSGEMAALRTAHTEIRARRHARGASR